MRDFSADHRWLSLNTATVRQQGDLVQIIEACARHGIRAIDPWRDQVASVGVDRAARAVRDAGLELSGYCRGGMFTSDVAHRMEALDENRRAIDEAKALGAPCLVLVVGGLPQFSRPGSAASKDIKGARANIAALEAKKNAANVDESKLVELANKLRAATEGNIFSPVDFVKNFDLVRLFIQLAADKIEINEYSGLKTVPFKMLDLFQKFSQFDFHLVSWNIK